MAIKQRVLAKLAAIETDVHAVAETGNLSLLDAAAKDLETVRGLCHSGLPRQFSVTYNEVFDGIITAVRTLLAGLSNDNPGEVCSLCLELVREIGKSIAKENHFKKEIVFLPYQASMWDSMESVWQAAINDSEHAIAYVVPIPYCDRAPDGGASEWHCEIAKFPLYVPTIDYRYIDLEDMHPDVIIIQNPYDNYNIVTSVDETYYSWNLKKWTNKLVYIPYFMIEEFDPDDEEALEDFSCFVFPGRGVMNADLTIVQSENIREAYIRLLLKRTDKDRAYWEKRILGLGSPKIDKVLATKREDILLPEDWRRVIEKPDGTWKTVVLYNARLGNLLKYKDKLLDKMEWVFQTFQERRDEVALLWRPHPLFEATVKARAPELWARYRWMVERYRREGWGIYDDSTDLHRAIAVSDGYYGDGSSIVCLYKATGKPVLLQDVRTDVGCLRFIGASRLSTTLYFFSLNLAGLFSLRLKDLKVGLVDIFPFTHIDEIGIFGEIVEYKNVLYFAPMQEIALWSFDMKEKMWKKYPIEEEVIQGCFLKFRFIYNFGHDIWLIPQEARSIVNFDAEKNEYIYLGSWYQILKDDINRISGYKQLFYIPAVLGDCIWLPCTFVNALICVDTKKKKERIYFIGNEDNRYRIVATAGDLWLQDQWGNLYVWKVGTKEFKLQHKDILGDRKFGNMIYAKGYIWIFENFADRFVKYDVKSHQCEEVSGYLPTDKSIEVGYAIPRKFDDDKIYLFPNEGNAFVEIDTCSGEMRMSCLSLENEDFFEFLSAYEKENISGWVEWDNRMIWQIARRLCDVLPDKTDLNCGRNIYLNVVA